MCRSGNDKSAHFYAWGADLATEVSGFVYPFITENPAFKPVFMHMIFDEQGQRPGIVKDGNVTATFEAWQADPYLDEEYTFFAEGSIMHDKIYSDTSARDELMQKCSMWDQRAVSKRKQGMNISRIRFRNGLLRHQQAVVTLHQPYARVVPSVTPA